jgi:hypothetical protein
MNYSIPASYVRLHACSTCSRRVERWDVRYGVLVRPHCRVFEPGERL